MNLLVCIQKGSNSPASRITLTIKAHRDNPLPYLAGTEHRGYLLAEFGAGHLVRTVTLPKEFQAEKIEASLDGGF